MINIKLEEIDVVNVIKLLKRVNLTGEEVPAYVDLINKFAEVLDDDKVSDKIEG